jgi:hypothetical protein
MADERTMSAIFCMQCSSSQDLELVSDRVKQVQMKALIRILTLGGAGR